FGVMLVVQVVSAAMLFPFLLRDLRAAAMVVAASWPFTVIAGILTGFSEPRVLGAAGLAVTAWLVGLALWRPALRTARAEAVGVTVAVLMALGVPLLWYLRAEYELQSDAVRWSGISGWGPTFGALAVALRNPHFL